MRIRSVTAAAFGPLVDETLELAPGLTVVSGPNESGKSSWHAAVHAALCGRRRGRGAPTRDDRAFAERHRPWYGDRWAVSAEIELADGRRVEMRHDLAGMVDCSATDLVLGRKVSDEVMVEGSPDASRWLGLDRRSYAATGWVAQADLLGVLDEADGLQEHLQRAAATAATTSSTAAGALDLLDAFARDRVGLDRTTSTRPLRLAGAEVEAARTHLREAERRHDEHLDLAARHDTVLGRVAAAVDGVQDAERWATATSGLRERGQALDRLAERADHAARLAAAHAGRPTVDRADAVPPLTGPSRRPGWLAAAATLAALAAVLLIAGQPLAAGGCLVLALAAGAAGATRPEAPVRVPARPTPTGSDADARVAAEEAARREGERAAAGAALIRYAVDLGLDVGTATDLGALDALHDDAARSLAEQRHRLAALERESERLAGTLVERARSLPGVPEAEERLAAAEAELARVERLRDTLGLTTSYLRRAQDRVHRDIAPVLARTLTRWLPEVTDGRYTEAVVDPASLEVRLRAAGHEWRAATALSVGTAEQVHLLLRVALAEHLTAPGESCPLVLDDVTVQADDARTPRVLDVLLALADDRQVVLFSQEPEVSAWADRRLARSARHTHVRLKQVDAV